MRRRLLVLAALTICAPCAFAEAQPILVAPGVDLSIAPDVDAAAGPTSYNVKNMDFDLWCQQTERYAIERYELDFLKQQQLDDRFRAQVSRDPLQNVQSKQDGLP